MIGIFVVKLRGVDNMSRRVNINKDKKVKIYQPKLSGSRYSTYVITDNYTDCNGFVSLKHSENAEYAKTWVDDNEK